MVPEEGIEPPTFGLQNRCSTAELSRPLATQRIGPNTPGFNFSGETRLCRGL